MHLDPTLILLQMIPFLVAVIGLWVIIFKPVLNLLQAREERIVGYRQDADRRAAEVKTKVDDFDARLQEASQAATVERARLRREIALKEGEIQEMTRAEGERMTLEARAQIRAAAEEGRILLRREAETLSRDIASIVLGREVH